MVKSFSHLKEEFFEDKYLSWTYRSIVGYFEDYGKAPTIPILENEVRKHAVDKQTPYFEVLKEIFDVKNVDEEYVRRELTGFIRRNIFVSSYKKAASLYNLQNAEGAYEFTKSKIDELLGVDFEKEEVVDFKRALQYVNEARTVSEKSVPTGIVPIDQAMHGGMSPGSLTTLLSGTNAGKSMALLNIGYHAMMAGKKVISVHHEDEEGPTVLRVLSRCTGIPYNKLVCPSDVLTGVEKGKLNIWGQHIHKYWKMKFMYGSETTVEQVRDWLMLQKKEFGFDLFIDDYGQFIRTKRKTEGERFTEAIVYRTLKQMALEMGVAALTCAQGNRIAQKVSKAGTSYLKSTDIAECFEIARVSSNIITLNRSDDGTKGNKLIYYLEKQRSGKVGIAVGCNTDFSRCMTHESVDDLGKPFASLSGRMWEENSINPLLTNGDSNVKDNS